MVKSQFKKLKLEEKIKQEVGLYIREQTFHSCFSFVSITRVELNNDLSEAKIFWDTYDSKKRGDIKKEIESISGRVRTHLGKVTHIKHIPNIKFHYDSQYESEQRIMELVKEDPTT